MVGALEGDATLVRLQLVVPQAELVHPTVEQTQLQPQREHDSVQPHHDGETAAGLLWGCARCSTHQALALADDDSTRILNTVSSTALSQTARF
jgi:hypothetical protein